MALFYISTDDIEGNFVFIEFVHAQPVVQSACIRMRCSAVTPKNLPPYSGACSAHKKIRLRGKEKGEGLSRPI